ncbi:MAG: energy-coupling factor transporter ATPase [Clostridiales bacterium GWF2_36_10]|nr:MAG: energy-coupling factor transporter ATPase [Clostridiales bacterium GWF2_36_10]HAN21454.1 energy-coupling factor transporter ATPase [Clostridiales bacterium]
MTFIKTDNLTFKYRDDEPEVVKNISLEIEKGSYTAILGHNGSGKSTLAKLLCGILQPVSGSVIVGGYLTSNEQDIYKIRESCGMVFQNPDNQIVASVVEEDVAFAPENLGVPPKEIRKIVDDCLKTVGMEQYALHSTYKLSGGQKQRVAIAGVLAMNPSCIIFDEATAMLDPTGRKDIAAAMKKLNKEKGITVITITHYMNEAIEADRVIVLNRGEVFLDGTPKEIFSEVEKLKSVALSVPQVTELLYLLQSDGYDFPKGILHTMEAADILENKVNLKSIGGNDR